MNPNRWILILIALYLGLATAFNVTVGIGEAPDEPPHVAFVRYIVEQRALPVQSPVSGMQAHQPPAYYTLGALLVGRIAPGDHQLVGNPSFDIVPGRLWARQRFYHTSDEAFPYQGLVLWYHLLRGLSTVLGAITVWAVYASARLVLPQRPAVALLAAGLVAFNPQFLFLTASVNNDNLATMSASLMLLVGLAAWRRPSLRLTAIMGLLVGLAALSKYTALAVAPGAVLALAAPYVRERRWRALAGHLAVIGILAVLMAGWWYVRNQQIYGDPLAQSAAYHALAPVRRYSPWQLRELPGDVATAFRSSWAQFGWMNITLHPVIYAALAAVCLAALGGVLRITWRAVSQRRWMQPELVPYLALALGAAGVTAFVVRYHLFVPANHGRLFFPGIVAFAFFLALGLSELAGRWQARLAGGLGAGLFALSVGSLAFVLAPAYAQPRMLAETDLHISHPMAARYGESVALRGFDVSSRTVRRGQPFNLTLYWQALQSVPANYWLMIQLLDPSGRPLAHMTTLPYLGRYATVLWHPGDLFADRYGLTVVPDALPGAANLVVLLDSRGTAPDETEWSVDGKPQGDRVELATLKVVPDAQPTYRPVHPISVQFGDVARLTGYDLTASSIRAGQPSGVTLYWQVLRPVDQDLHVFVHLLCGQSMAAQDDGVPGKGWYPTTIWAAGDSIRDEHSLEVEPSLPAGVCTLSAGLYDFETENRLPAVDAQGRRLVDDRAELARLEVVP